MGTFWGHKIRILASTHKQPCAASLYGVLNLIVAIKMMVPPLNNTRQTVKKLVNGGNQSAEPLITVFYSLFTSFSPVFYVAIRIHSFRDRLPF